MQYIAFLRGINVSGKNKIKMADLRQNLTELEFKNIKTYIQSGNIIFESSITDKVILEQQINQKIKEKYDFDVPTLVLAPSELQNAIAQHTFAQNEDNDKKGIYFTFLATIPTTEKLEAFQQLEYQNEFFKIDQQVIYCYYPKGYGRAKLTNTKIEKTLGVQATTRNWRTCNKIISLLELT